MDFVAGQLANRMKLRTLTIIDVFSRQALAVEVGQHLRSEHVVAVLNQLIEHRGPPQYLFVDNGSEFSRQLLDLWAYHHWHESTSPGLESQRTIATLRR